MTPIETNCKPKHPYYFAPTFLGSLCIHLLGDLFMLKGPDQLDLWLSAAHRETTFEELETQGSLCRSLTKYFEVAIPATVRGDCIRPDCRPLFLFTGVCLHQKFPLHQRCFAVVSSQLVLGRTLAVSTYFALLLATWMAYTLANT